jgi:hypothetical protein
MKVVIREFNNDSQRRAAGKNSLISTTQDEYAVLSKTMKW